MDPLTEAVLAGVPPDRLAKEPVPTEHTAAHLRAEDVDVFGDAADRDVRRTLRVDPVPMPELAVDEVLIAVMASSINCPAVAVTAVVADPHPPPGVVHGGHQVQVDRPRDPCRDDVPGLDLARSVADLRPQPHRSSSRGGDGGRPTIGA
jgi:crotonyl-CoA reductase